MEKGSRKNKSCQGRQSRSRAKRTLDQISFFCYEGMRRRRWGGAPRPKRSARRARQKGRHPTFLTSAEEAQKKTPFFIKFFCASFASIGAEFRLIFKAVSRKALNGERKRGEKIYRIFFSPCLAPLSRIQMKEAPKMYGDITEAS